MCNDKTWFDAVVLGWGGKITNKNKNWANVQLNDTGQCITLHKVHWRDAVEDINIVQIQAKHEKLDKMRQFNTYDEVTETGQLHSFSTWVFWKRGDVTRACLVAQGYEELIKANQKDSPTVSRDNFCTFLFITSNHQWHVETTEIKSAFLKVNLLKEMFI